MRIFFVRAAAAALLSLVAVNAGAATLIGTFLDDAAWTLIHPGSGPGDSENNPNNWLRWDPGQQVIWDLTGNTLSAVGPQEFTLSNAKGSVGTFTLVSASFDLSGANGFAGGTLTYDLSVAGGAGPFGTVDITGGTFTFAEASYGSTPFNSSTFDGTTLEMFAWGGDVDNGIGIDIGTGAVVPLPAPLLLFASGLLGLGALRRRS
ncbi:MAG: VPLPA-CTERM sorting domain-containing protein [Gammaproteobacteria bacterium]|nr:VPLPA-CTERM sorting domain-containing protein [Gammaproteobacteria bacterium]NNF60981.1 hypothetical protein [Gammaproteobacteria bacterium]NNM21105.1 hypothetical protein [Gammaproteobacteria bacterium]